MKDLQKEKKNVERTLRCFFDGVDKLDADMIKKALHPLQRSFSITPDGLCGMPMLAWDKFIQDVKNDPDNTLNKGSKKRILSIDVTGTAASAKAELAFSDVVFTDYYNLLKIGDQWYIMNTTYHKAPNDKK
ncbi:MAG: nuclear transport factor 2 family protein [Candidatus Zixiibacteriota bacterium]|nr:MAG: nuclear transport factor 2 family protein [candidate division Zixibacteria bacterium]